MEDRETQLLLTREKARKAKEILESEVMGEVFKAIENQALEAALRVKPDEHELRKHHLDKVVVIRELATELGALVVAGMVADRQPPTL